MEAEPEPPQPANGDSGEASADSKANGPGGHRLARKAESARQARLRHKNFVNDLEQEVRLLNIKASELKQRRSSGLDSAARSVVGDVHQALSSSQREQLLLWLEQNISDASAAPTSVQRVLPELLRAANSDELQTCRLSAPPQWTDDAAPATRHSEMECASLMLGLHMLSPHTHPEAPPSASF